MASFSSSSSSLLKTIFLITILVIALFSGSSSATRPGKTFTVGREGSTESGIDCNMLRPKNMTAFRFRGQTFNFFPKGAPIPPSGPSKRHNSVPEN
ncbi:hypothetical protein CsatB_019871 [Cannabis sativa]|uniref:Uncharacterized protein n=1 Tax=Cannabis sativa TaxID=3483 RepID=A0A7J6EEI8_CANSA|nr:hypothetical protein F8388_019506 [Cannabis sativa]